MEEEWWPTADDDAHGGSTHPNMAFHMLFPCLGCIRRVLASSLFRCWGELDAE